MTRVFRAPGKLVLVGEYAVLDGAPAVVAAVDRGVACAVSPAPDRRIETPGDARFARATLETLGAPPARYRFSDWNPSPTATALYTMARPAVAAVSSRARWAPSSSLPLILDMFRK